MLVYWILLQGKELFGIPEAPKYIPKSLTVRQTIGNDGMLETLGIGTEKTMAIMDLQGPIPLDMIVALERAKLVDNFPQKLATEVLEPKPGTSSRIIAGSVDNECVLVRIWCFENYTRFNKFEKKKIRFCENIKWLTTKKILEPMWTV